MRFFEIYLKSLTLSVISALMLGCTHKNNKTKIMPLVTIEKKQFGTTKEGQNVDQYLLENKSGMQISIITYGGIITSWTSADKNGDYKDIVLGYNTLEEYESETPYFGALIGRYGNRIAEGRFSLNDTTYTLAVNNAVNHLHGGLKGFDKVVWEAETITSDTEAALVLKYLSKDMEEGYPGNLVITVTYMLNDNNELEVKYEASTDKTTIVNLTQHSYFNLTADFNQTVLDHELTINADSFIPVDETLIPLGNLSDVSQTPFDFRASKRIGQHINEENTQLINGLGYDHCWALNDQDKGMRFAASAYEPVSGRLLEVFTDEPGIQFYSGNFLDGSLPSKSGGVYNQRTGFCLETQHYPDSPNQEDFPSVVLHPDEKYESHTTFRLSVK
ncbi:MAG: galactose-1-epimerase [Flavobacteriaceae bacterium]|nr:galactose-1-epimerase [Flavobacteriaceae bacterium]